MFNTLILTISNCLGARVPAPSVGNTIAYVMRRVHANVTCGEEYDVDKKAVVDVYTFRTVPLPFAYNCGKGGINTVKTRDKGHSTKKKAAPSRIGQGSGTDVGSL